ncbi:MAG TPA: response regulator, partial [Candidatus Limnocylindria bacterium]|nr:response regulator [Candidatus Limnocylindria bacterium]
SREFLELMSAALEPHGHIVTCIAENASLETLVESRPDLLIIDLRLEQPAQNLSGWELVVLASHHEALGRIPILVCSGDQAALRSHAPEIGRSERFATLAKPFQVAELEALAERLLSGNGPTAEPH